jgi:hypothetical protein
VATQLRFDLCLLLEVSPIPHTMGAYPFLQFSSANAIWCLSPFQYLRVPDEVIDMVKDEVAEKSTPLLRPPRCSVRPRLMVPSFRQCTLRSTSCILSCTVQASGLGVEGAAVGAAAGGVDAVAVAVAVVAPAINSLHRTTAHVPTSLIILCLLLLFNK